MNRYVKTALLAGAAWSALSTYALAQDVPPQDAAPQEPAVSTLDEIVVTARRREESLQDVPIAISVLSAETLDQTGAPDITVLQQTTPNATVQVARGSNSTLIGFIRGVGQQDPLWGFEPGVGLYVDDVYIARPQGAVLDIFDIERIEVLRGPQGTLYGRNTIGGAIKYVTGRLDRDAPTFTARTNLGSYDQRDLILSGSVPLSDTFAVGGAVGIYHRDGFGENLTTGADHYNKDVKAVRASAEWTPSDNLFVRLSADYLQDDSNPRHGYREQGFLGLPDYEPLDNVYDTRAGSGDDNQVESSGVSASIDWNFSDTMTFRSITAWREGETNGTIDFDNTPNPTLDIPAYYADSQFSQEFQLLYEGDRMQGVFGVYYLDATAEGAFDTVLGLLNTTILAAGSVDTRSFAAFGDLSIDLTDTLSASVGGRWTRDERSADVLRQAYTGIRSPFFGNAAAIPAAFANTDYTNSATFEEFTPRVSLTWEPIQELTLYGSYSKGFKSGGFDMRGDALLTPDTVNGYQPEFVDTFELGFHSNFWDRRASLSGAVFHSKYEDMQITRQEPTILGGIASFVDNAASATLHGAELEGRFFLTDNLSANFALGWIDGEFDEYLTVIVNPAFDPLQPVGPGNERTLPADFSNAAGFQNTPDWTGSLSVTYTQPLADGLLAFTPSLAYRGDSQMFEFANAAIDQDAYTLVNASVTWTSSDDRWRVGVHGLNLADEEYRVGGYNFPLSAGAFFGNSVISFYGPPRTITASLQYRY